ncbi:MAG: cysteine methyltransferase [Firmicutes bacterium]|nr:cysteine methyltransferase [Bacillota bacterium]
MGNVFFYSTMVGEIGIADNGTAITKVYFSRGHRPEAQEVGESALIKTAAAQLKEYFGGKRKSFEFPLAPEGTVFQQAVWEALQVIPYGETRSYKDIAVSINQPNAARAVGMANNRNPIAIVIPCHRVIGANGKLVGYGGGLDIKEKLLGLEQAVLVN